ncbi:MAG: YdeI/OmpD-associated family protein [Cyclobacteriaceae bacterium]|nr:YdeI/OmpD-associated family protein [Cyclobacteriaceae bacterium]
MKTYSINKTYKLQKFEGKGGWTYALIPEIAQNKKNPFGWVTVSGFIDGFELKHYKLMPYSNGLLFMPVKASTRKVIGKQAGNTVHIKLNIDTSPIKIPAEIIDCFKNEPPSIYTAFLDFTQSEQKAYIDWIDEAKKEETKVERIVKMMERVLDGKTFYD